MTYYFVAACARAGSRLLDTFCAWSGLIRAASARGISHATGLTLSEAQYDFANELALPDVNIHLTSYENFPAKRPYNAGISIGAFEHFVKPGMSQAERLRIHEKFFPHVARWLNPGGTLWLQTAHWADIDRAYADEIVSTDVFRESDHPLLSEISPSSRMKFEPTLMTGNADDHVRTLKEWLRRPRLHQATIEAGLRGLGRVKFFVDYFRTSILGFRKRQIGFARVGTV